MMMGRSQCQSQMPFDVCKHEILRAFNFNRHTDEDEQKTENKIYDCNKIQRNCLLPKFCDNKTINFQLVNHFIICDRVERRVCAMLAHNQPQLQRACQKASQSYTDNVAKLLSGRPGTIFTFSVLLFIRNTIKRKE